MIYPPTDQWPVNKNAMMVWSLMAYVDGCLYKTRSNLLVEIAESCQQ